MRTRGTFAGVVVAVMMVAAALTLSHGSQASGAGVQAVAALPAANKPAPPKPPRTVPAAPTTTVNPVALPANSGTGRRIVYSNSKMRIWAVDGAGNVVKTHRVSGKRGIPYSGTYRVYSRSLYTQAVQDPSIKWMYMVRFAYTPSGGRVGFHEIPKKCGKTGCYVLQNEAQLGQALSGGCVRQSTADAIWVWNWAGIGTKVVVLP
jgi:lipoprotein-anchoring transpeptidase ErfK/SrfK